jgi:RNA polymerase sigma factor (sigma-70 family)
VRRAIVNEFLRRERGRRPDDLMATPPDQPALSKRVDDAIADHDRMWRALGELPARQRAVLVLRYYEDLPDPQIADVLGCRRSTVRSLAARGLAALRPLIGAERTDVMEGNPR